MRPGRLPFQPLTDALGLVMSASGRGTGKSGWERVHGNPVAVLSELTGVHRRRLTRWTRDGIPDEEADKIACALGLHVALIWPSWFAEPVENIAHSPQESPTDVPPTFHNPNVLR